MPPDFDLNDPDAAGYCPSCGSGYAARVTRCPPCGVVLVPRDHVEATTRIRQPNEEAEATVLLCELDEPVKANLLGLELDQAGVPY